MRCRVYMHSKPGFWEHYEGHVDVETLNVADAPRLAARKLKRTTFPDRGLSAWVIKRVECLGEGSTT